MSYCFPVLKLSEIIGFFHERKIDVVESDFRKPDPLRWRQIYGILLELLSNIPPDQVYQNGLCLMVKSDDIFEYPELQSESLPISVLVLSLQRVMITCGIKDFTLQDITDPSLKRLVRVCSAAINLYKFRDSRVNIFDNYKEENKKYKEIYDELRQKINRYKSIRAEQEPEIKRTQDGIDALTVTMDKCQKQSASKQKDMQEVKTDLAEKKALVDQVKVEIIEQEKLIENIALKIVQSPEKIRKELERNQERMVSLKNEIVEKRNRRTEWTRQADIFKLRETTADKLFKLLQSCQLEKDQERDLLKDISQNGETIQEALSNLEEISVKKSQLEARIDSKKETISNFNAQLTAKKRALAEHLEQIKSQKMSYTKKHNRETEQVEENIRQQQTALDDKQNDDDELNERLDTITSLYTQLSEKYGERQEKLGEEWDKFLQTFDVRK